jgi:hypothetical protein
MSHQADSAVLDLLHQLQALVPAVLLSPRQPASNITHLQQRDNVKTTKEPQANSDPTKQPHPLKIKIASLLDHFQLISSVLPARPSTASIAVAHSDDELLCGSTSSNASCQAKSTEMEPLLNGVGAPHQQQQNNAEHLANRLPLGQTHDHRHDAQHRTGSISGTQPIRVLSNEQRLLQESVASRCQSFHELPQWEQLTATGSRTVVQPKSSGEPVAPVGHLATTWEHMGDTAASLPAHSSVLSSHANEHPADPQSLDQFHTYVGDGSFADGSEDEQLLFSFMGLDDSMEAAVAKARAFVRAGLLKPTPGNTVSLGMVSDMGVDIHRPSSVIQACRFLQRLGWAIDAECHDFVGVGSQETAEFTQAPSGAPGGEPVRLLLRPISHQQSHESAANRVDGIAPEHLSSSTRVSGKRSVQRFLRSVFGYLIDSSRTSRTAGKTMLRPHSESNSFVVPAVHIRRTMPELPCRCDHMSKD